jgi:hypothetical protein
MTTIGLADVKHFIRMPGYWDLAEMKKWQLKDGTTFDAVIMRFAAALSLFNGSLRSGYLSNYVKTTSEMIFEYGVGGDSAGLKEISEFDNPDPILGDSTGHMIPMKDYGGSLGWTYLGLRRARAAQLDADIRLVIERARNTWDKALMIRMFKSIYEPVGSAGRSMPFADGGTADANFVPVSYEGSQFASSHNHFGRQTDDAAGRLAGAKAMAANLYEHGIMPPYDLFIPAVDITDWTAVTGFIKPERAWLQTMGVETRAKVADDYIGVLEMDRTWAFIKPFNRLPTNYAGMFKPAGFGSPNAPLVVRYEEGFPLGLSLVGRLQNFPMEESIAYFTFGVGIANRLAGAATFFAAGGAYVDPVIL